MKETNKVVCVLAYFLFFIPLLVDSKNNDYRFHANQGLDLFLLYLVIHFAGMIIPFMNSHIVNLVSGILMFVLSIIGIINAVHGENKELPLIGKITVIKEV